MGFEIGRSYSRDEIAAMVGGGSTQDYMPNENGKVLCLCLSQEHTPGEEPVVLVGMGPGVEREAEMFCAQKTPVPVFFKKKKSYLWEYAGEYSCGGWTDDPDELASYGEASGRSNLTKVIFLKLFIDKN